MLKHAEGIARHALGCATRAEPAGVAWRVVGYIVVKHAKYDVLTERVALFVRNTNH